MQPNPLAGLHDIIAPSQVSWWPLAPAWWVIITLLFIAICAVAFWFYNNHKFKKPKRYAIDLSKTEQSPLKLHIILKRLVIEYYDKRLAAQSTTNWCNTLNALTGLSFSEQEILSLYNTEQANEALTDKFRQGIKQFKLKESVHV